MNAPVLVVGLAPGLHGANATGLPFTGDASGALLFRVLEDAGIAPDAAERHGASWLACRITNAVKCLPPGNRPAAAEVRACAGFLAHELDAVPPGGVILTLGRVGHDAVLDAFGLTRAGFPFMHGAVHEGPGDRSIMASYHCSRYNVNTGRLTPAMLADVVRAARERAERAHA